jgi:hypothetical protein
MRISLTLDEQTAQALRRRADAHHTSLPRYLADLARAEAQREKDELAEEGYRLLAGDTLAFAENALSIANQDWK